MPMIQQGKAKKEQAAKAKQPAVPTAPQEGAVAADGEEPATQEEQDSYDEAMEMLYKMLYVDDKTSATIVDMIQPNGKVDSIVKASVLIIQQLDTKLDLDASVIPELVMDVPDRLIEIAEKSKRMTFSEGELKAILGSTQEMVMQVIDVDAGEARRMMDNVSPEQKAQATRDYQKFLSESEGDDQSGQSAQPTGAPGMDPTAATAESAVPQEQVPAGTGQPEEPVIA